MFSQLSEANQLLLLTFERDSGKTDSEKCVEAGLRSCNVLVKILALRLIFLFADNLWCIPGALANVVYERYSN